MEAASDSGKEKYIFPAGGNYIVTVSGLTKVSKAALLGRALIIRHFPFTIGRSSFGSAFSSSGADFSISEAEPGRISRKHLSIDLQDEQIVLVDENSRFGSMINGEQLGKNAGGKDRISLRYGVNEVKLGGRSSPFVFEIDVTKNDETKVFEDYVRSGDHVVPAVEPVEADRRGDAGQRRVRRGGECQPGEHFVRRGRLAERMDGAVGRFGHSDQPDQAGVDPVREVLPGAIIEKLPLHG